MNDHSKIIKFDPDRAPLRIRPAKFCQHKHLVVCEKSRTLECDVCGATIDPFDFMLRWAKEDRFLEYRLKEMQEDLIRTAKKIQNLKRIEKNIGARLRRRGYAPSPERKEGKG